MLDSVKRIDGCKACPFRQSKVDTGSGFMMGWCAHYQQSYMLTDGLDRPDFCEITKVAVLTDEIDMAEIALRAQDCRDAIHKTLMDLTRMLDEHPEGYDGPCECRLCLSYADCEGLDFDRTEQ